MKTFIKYLIISICFAVLGACGGGDSSGTPADNGGDGGGGGGGGQNQVEPLSFFEKELAKKWYRYHAYDGSGMYFVFKGDRTACYFEISSSGTRTKEIKYIHWELVSMNGSTKDYDIILTYGSGSTTSSNEFYYDTMEYIRGGTVIW